MRAWEPTSSVEIKVFIAVLIYMGVVRLPAYEDYWSAKYSKFICANHITLNRFENLKRYMHISDPELKPSSKNQCSKSDDSKDAVQEKCLRWQYKLEPIASEFRSLCSQY